MTTVRTSCPFCGDIDLPITAIVLVTVQGQPELDRYQFTCDQCGHYVTKHADARVVAALRKGNADETITIVPDETKDPARNNPNPITWDDLLDATNDMDAELALLDLEPEDAT